MYDGNPDIKALNGMYRSAKTGVDTINLILPKVKGANLKKDLAGQMLGYHNFIKTSSEKLHELNQIPAVDNVLKKIPAYTCISFNTLVDCSDSHMAEMVIDSSAAGMVEITRKLNQNRNLSEDVAKLGSDIVEFEKNNMENIRKYL